MVSEPGLEPDTVRGDHVDAASSDSFGGRDRTFNLRIQSPLFCQLNYPERTLISRCTAPPLRGPEPREARGAPREEQEEPGAREVQ